MKDFKDFVLFHDGYNRVYLIDSVKNVSYFDLENKEWMELKWKRKWPGRFENCDVHWIDDNVLYELRWSGRESHFFLDAFDLSNENSKWESESIDIRNDVVFKQAFAS